VERCGEIPRRAGVTFGLNVDSDYLELEFERGVGVISTAESVCKHAIYVVVVRESEGASFLRADHDGFNLSPLPPDRVPNWFVPATLPERTTMSPPAEGGAVSYTEYLVCAFGWPALALRGTTLDVWGATEPFNRYQDCILEHQPDVTLPLGIIWPGFLINTLTFAFMWFMILFAADRAVRSLKHRRALRRGECPICRYDLLGDFSSGCPECGWNRAGSAISVPHSGQTPDSLPERS